MSNGKLKWYNPVKGFGFITPDPEGSQPDIFVHISEFKNAGIPENEITEGMALTYEENDFRGKKVAGSLKRS
jgi:CspA family cold shock protein